MPGQVPPPIDDIDAYWSEGEKAMVEHSLACSFVGSPESVQRGIAAFVAATGADELMVTSQIFDHAARLRSYEITAQIRERIGRA